MLQSLGMVCTIKRMFWLVFWPAWQQAFSEKNILHAYTKTGIFPYNPRLLINQITKPAIPTAIAEEPLCPATPFTSRDVRNLE